MAFDEATRTITGIAGSVIERNRFVAHATDGKYDHAGAGVLADGVSMEPADADLKAFSMGIKNGSVVKVEAGAAVTANADVTPDSVGRAVTSTSTDAICGKALEAASAAGDIIAVLFSYRGVTA